jgi:hypothetical protein
LKIKGLEENQRLFALAGNSRLDLPFSQYAAATRGQASKGDPNDTGQHCEKR